MKILDYVRETRAEMKHVNWLSRKQALLYTIAVVVVSVAVALYLGFFDYLFSTGLSQLIG